MKTEKPASVLLTEHPVFHTFAEDIPRSAQNGLKRMTEEC